MYWNYFYRAFACILHNRCLKSSCSRCVCRQSYAGCGLGISTCNNISQVVGRSVSSFSQLTVTVIWPPVCTGCAPVLIVTFTGFETEGICLGSIILEDVKARPWFKDPTLWAFNWWDKHIKRRTDTDHRTYLVCTFANRERTEKGVRLQNVDVRSIDLWLIGLRIV